MSCRPTLALIAFLAIPSTAVAQHGGAVTSASTTPPREASQFDFLIGQWQLVVRPRATSLAARIHGAPRLVGGWKAWRAYDGWGVEDELRIVDRSGNPVTLTHSMRAFDAAARRWSLSSLDVYRGRFSTATGEWRDGRMHLSGQGTDSEGRPYVTRTQFYDITPHSFQVRQERSEDNGRTWTEGVVTIEARRVAAAPAR